MSNFVNQATGAMKEGLGKLTGNEQRKEEGHAQRAQGVGEQKLQNEGQSAKQNPAANQAKGGMQQAGGAAKENIGKAMGNPDMQQQGRNLRSQGKGEQEINAQRQQD
ncbi:hypothetical protein H4R20_001184 [Coemansia guatemalensis]|uniref:CsbD-like domain-containing protein n=1 Tax=Coemansia guatemalensis TaxID=2761395 RepID=A0A9W8I3V0_9FUNG|nr:hypothetical protein H4R20_001184 [Coemansia guatemalensis]